MEENFMERIYYDIILQLPSLKTSLKEIKLFEKLDRLEKELKLKCAEEQFENVKKLISCMDEIRDCESLLIFKLSFKLGVNLGFACGEEIQKLL